MQRIQLLAAASLIALAAPLGAHELELGRLLVADHEAATIRVLDLDTGKISHEFAVPVANPGLAAADRGRLGVVVTRDEAGTVRLLDTGIRFEGHGDHDDLVKTEPGWLDVAVTGTRPAHLVEHAGRFAIFYDGRREEGIAAKAVVLDLADPAAAPRVWDSPGAQHGVAVPLEDGALLVSTPNPDFVANKEGASSLPIGIKILDEADKVVAELDDLAAPDRSCNGFHGYAAVGERLVFGCFQADPGHPQSDGGALIVATDADGVTSRKLAYPDGRRASTIKATDGRWAVGNYGVSGAYTAFLRIDPATPELTMADVLEQPGGQPSCHFALDGGGRLLVNLTPDGTLRAYEIASWREVLAMETVAPFDCAWNATAPKPELAVVGDRAYVSDPLGGRITEFDLGRRQANRVLAIGGMPARLAGGGDGH
jgi:hypothetical protein